MKLLKNKLDRLSEKTFVSEVLFRFGHKSNLKILNVSVGRKKLSNQLLLPHPNWEVVDLDASPFTLDGAWGCAKAMGHDLGSFIGFDNLHSYPTQNKFDLLMAYRVLSELANPSEVIGILVSLMKPGSTILVTDQSKLRDEIIHPYMKLKRIRLIFIPV